MVYKPTNITGGPHPVDIFTEYCRVNLFARHAPRRLGNSTLTHAGSPGAM